MDLYKYTLKGMQQNSNSNDDEERKRKQRELEQRTREQETKRRQEKIDAQTKAMEELAKADAAKKQLAEQRQVDARNKKLAQVEEIAHPVKASTNSGGGRGFDVISNPTSRTMDNLPQSNSRQAYKKWYEGEDVRKYKDYSNELGEDVRNTIEYSRAAGLKDDEIKNSLIPQEDNTIEQRLEEISSKLKPGRESWGQTMQEGWYEKELQNMLSKETLRQMNGLPNKADVIQKWMADNPELSISEDANLIDKGVRFLSEGFKQQVDSYSAASKNWESWAIAGAIVAGASLLAPVTGGSSLLVGGTLLGNSVLALGSLGALKVGMSYGAWKHMYELETADKYNQYIQEGTHPDIARTTAMTVGAVNGMVEFMQIDSAFSTIPGVANLLDNGKKLAGKEFTKELTKIAANYGVDLLGNALEESTQEATGLMGLELSKYLENAPNPNTLEGLKVLAKTFDNEDYRQRVLQSGMDALQSMWLSPIVSSGVRQGASMGVNSAITKSQSKKVNGYYTAEERQSQEFNDAQKKMLLTDTEENQIDMMIKDYNESRDERTLAAMVTTEQVLDAIAQREDTTNQERELIQKSRDKINNIVSKAMYDAKDENSDIEYRPTNNIDIETNILSPDFEGETYTQGFNEYAIERYNDAKNARVLDTIKEELLKGTSKAEIASKITKALPRKMRGPLDIATMINAVETVNNEVRTQKVMNNFYNYEQMKDYKPAEGLEETQTAIKATEDPQTDVKGVSNTIAQTDIESPTESLAEPTNENTENTKVKVNVNAENVLKDAKNKGQAATHLWSFIETEDKDNWYNYLSYLSDGADIREAQKIYDMVTDENIGKEEFESLSKLQDELYNVEIDASEDLKGLVEPENDTKSADIEETSSKFQTSGVVKVPVSKVFKDEKRFQFRYYGTTNKLDGATFDQDLSGPLMLFRDEFRDLYVFNGHHRLRLAEQSGVEYIDARIYDSKDYTAEAARVLGAVVNIAENNAEAIDVAKVLRDSTITADELKKYVSPRSKVMKDGIALSNLNDWIFTQVATKQISEDIAIVIGNELPSNTTAQNDIVKAVDKMRVEGKDVTPSKLREMIAQAKGTAQVEYTEQTMLGDITSTKSVAYERAELVDYVKGQLKSKKSLLKSVTKDKNASMLESLGNKIAADENTEQLEQSELALLLLDKTLNYQGTKVNKLFNDLALEYSQAEPKDRAAIKRKALDELISLMEGGNLLGENETTKSKRKASSIIRAIQDSNSDGERGQGSINDSDQIITEEQEEIAGQEALFALREQPQVEIVADDDVKNTRAYKSTIKIVEALQKNVFFNGLKVNYSNKSGKISFESKKELKEYGYEHYEVGKTYYIYGSYDNRTREITLNSEAARDTILEEAIHDIQSRIQEINPELGVTIQAWENEVREQAAALGYEIPGGYELLAQALVFSELGYASSNKDIANLIAVDDEIVVGMKAILGRDVLKEGQGLVESETAKQDRELKGMYENYAKRIFTQDGFLDNLLEAEENRKTEIRTELANARAATYYHPSNGQYVIVSPSTKGAKYQVTTFSPKFGPISDGQFDTIDEVADRLVEDKFYYKANEIHYQLKQFTRGVVDELYGIAISRGYRTDNNTTTNRERISFQLNDTQIIEAYHDAQIGNFSAQDFDELILHNNELEDRVKQIIISRIRDAIDNGYDVPNSEVRIGQYLNRFYNIAMPAIKGKRFDLRIKGNKVEVGVSDFQTDGERGFYKYDVYNTLEEAISNYKENLFLFEETDLDKALNEIVEKDFSYTVEMLRASKGITKRDAKQQVFNDIKSDYQEFRDNMETYRHKGLNYNFDMKPHYAISYQLKEAANIDTQEFKKWFKDSKVVDENGDPLVVYHGTKAAGFTEFDRTFNDYGRPGFFFSNLLRTAKSYSGSNYIVKPVQEIRNISGAQELAKLYNMHINIYYGYEGIWGYDKEVYLEGNPGITEDDLDVKYNLFSENNYERVVEYDNTEELLNNVAKDIVNSGNIVGNYAVYLNMKNPLIIDGNGTNWNDIQGMTTNEWVKEISEGNYTHDGIIFRDITDNGEFGGRLASDVYVAFNPTQIKSIYNNGMFNEYDPNINYQLKESNIVNVDGFYSNLENVINTKMGKRAKGSDLMNMLTKNGVKPEEMEWFEIANFLDGKDFVYKNEILDHMRNKAIEFSSIDMGNEFKSYTLDGGDNYRFNAYVYNNNPGTPFIYQPHFGSVQNVIGHTRYKDRVGINGEKILLIEELQSDWHQKGRQEGYHEIDTVLKENIKKEIESKKQAVLVLENRADEANEKYKELDSQIKDDITQIALIKEAREYLEERWRLEAEARELQYEWMEIERSLYFSDGKIPNAPLKESITDFLFKQAIKDAVEGGYDSIAWTTGEQQGERWNVGQYISEIRWVKTAEDAYSVVTYDKSDNNIMEERGLTVNQLAGYFGKEVANTIASSEYNSDTIKGQQIKYSNFYNKLYDNYIPRMIKKYGKKWGINVDDINIGNNSEFNEQLLYAARNGREMQTILTQPSIPVTPAMIEDVMTQGQPLFQLKEEGSNGNLLAIHNLSEEQLKNVIKLGGFPMPSIAVVKTDHLHTKYGNISILFNKDTVDPQVNKYNKIYGWDAYTPTFPEIGYKLNDKIVSGLYKKWDKLAENSPYQYGASTIVYNFEDNVDRNNLDQAKEWLSKQEYMKYVYLKDNGIDYETAYKSKKYSRYANNEQLQYFIDNYKGDIEALNELGFDELQELKPLFKDTLMQEIIAKDKSSKYLMENMIDTTLESYHTISDIAMAAYKLNKYGLVQEVDERATIENMDLVINKEDMMNWINKETEGIIEKEGIRNKKDMFTPSGNRRSFEQTYDPITLDNVVKAMKGEQQKGKGSMFYGTSEIAGAVSKDYQTIDEMKTDIDRLRTIGDEGFEELLSAYSEQLREIGKEMMEGYSYDNYFMAIDNAMQSIGEIGASGKFTDANIKKILKEYGFNVNDKIVKDIQGILKDLQELPTEYFEAKPQRAVYLNEIQAVIAPDTLSLELEQMLKDNGVNLIEKYNNEDETTREQTRQQAMDNVLRQNDVSFQLKAADTTTKQFKNWFKDSKVVDEEGKPLVVYHGSPNTFTEFRPSTAPGWGKGIYFTDNAENATEYAYSKEGIKPLYEVYLSIDNPYTDETRLSDDDIENTRAYKERQNAVPMVDGEHDYSIDARDLFGEDGEFANSVIRELGYDGIVTEGSNNINGKEIVVFDPTQIKSVYNYGAWDVNDANIYYQLKEEPDMEERSWGQTVRDADITNPELKQILTDNRFMYEVKHNEDTMINAAKLIDEKGLNWVEARLLSELDIKDPTLGAASQILIFKFMQEGETDRAFKMIDAIAPKLTTMGQAIQIFSVFGRQTPEGMLRYANQTLRGTMTQQDIINTNKDTKILVDEFNKINREVLEEIDLVGELKAIQEISPEEMLATRIASTLSSTKPREKDALQMMVDTLFKVAQESPLPNNKAIPTDPLLFVADAIVNREEYRNVWEIAKEIVADKFKDDPDKLAMLEDYFNMGINRTFAESQLKKAMGNELKDMDIEIRKIVREHFSVTNNVTDSLVDKLVERSDLTNAEAVILERYIRKQMDINTRAAKESILKNTFKERKKYERKTLDQKIIELSNLGALQNINYKHLVAEKLGLATMTPELGDYIYNQANYIQTLQPGRQRDVEVGKMIKEIMDHVPTSKWSKVATFRIISMLLSGKTTVRNLLGNNMFKDLEFFTLNTVGATLDKAISMRTGNRTALFRLLDAHKDENTTIMRY